MAFTLSSHSINQSEIKREKLAFLFTESVVLLITDYSKAKDQLEILKKRAIKGQVSTKVKIFEKKGGKNNLVEELVIKPSFYGE